MKVLITGGSGFVGTHLAEEYKKNGYEVICSDLYPSNNVIALDILKPEMIHKVLMEYKPDVFVNMAGQANVAQSWKNPQMTMQLNTIGVINILEEINKIDNSIRMIVVGSSDEYGKLGDLGVNVNEEIQVNPMTPYAISKYAQELFSKIYVQVYGLDICMIRLFNLGGAGQAKGFMISDFASGIAEIEAGQKNELLVGNLDSARDFTHVKDACRAIRMISEKGHSGEVYNICSGRTYTAREVLHQMLKVSVTEIMVKQDPKRVRPSDTPVICGNHDKLTKHTGWVPELGIDEILRESLSFWREKVQSMGIT